MKKYYYNAKTGEIASYNVEGNLTDFSRGVLIAYGDYLTTGIGTLKEAIEWAKTHGVCNKCKSSRATDENDRCIFCGETVEFKKVRIIDENRKQSNNII